MAHAPSNPTKYHQGKYKIKNPNKYMGNPMDIVYRSSWEYKFMVYCDLTPEVIRWGSETLTIPYVDYKGKSRRYIPDFYVETRNSQFPELMNRFLIEIKPDAETREPIIPKTISEKKLKNLQYACGVWQKNKHKWYYANEWCKRRDIQFKLVTEKHLHLFKV